MEIGKFSAVVHLFWVDGDRVGTQRDCIIGITFRKQGKVETRIDCCYVQLLLKFNKVALWYILIYAGFVILCAVLVLCERT
jgi:hypothetical protein